MKNGKLLLALALCVALLGASIAWAESAQEPAEETMTFFDLLTPKTLAGETLEGSALAGEKLTLVNLWATWCGPCVRELPELEAVSAAYADKGVRVLGVTVDAVNEATLEPDADTIA